MTRATIQNGSFPDCSRSVGARAETTAWVFTIPVQYCPQIPMWTIDDDDNDMIAFMDYTDLEVLKKNFMYHYDGNRAPMGIFLHPRQ